VRRRPLCLATALVASAGLLLTACTSSQGGHKPTSSTSSATVAANPTLGPVTNVNASIDACGQGWTDPHAGQQTFVVKDVDIVPGEVYLTNAKTGDVFAFLEPISPATTANLSIDLGSGTYAFRCAMEDQDVVVGPTVTIPGNVPDPVPPVAPVSQNDLIPPTKAYETYVEGKLPGLAKQVGTLEADIAGGQLAKARTDWLPAHLTYEQLGAAYDAFGDIDASINGTTAGLPGGLADKDFTGFHRIEYGLWHGQSAATLTPYAQQLVKDVATLRSQFPTAQITPLDVSIRAHEIMENALQFELTGETDYGSNTNLATVSANLQGTVVVLGLIKSLLVPRYPALGQLESELTQTQQAVAATDVHGTWTPWSGLSTSQREHINADVSELVELLAPIAAICEPRRTSQ
jgi:iron uptake system component EfeO